MDTTVVVAAMGFVSTLAGAWLAAHWQRGGAREAQILDAKLTAYGECAATLYEYRRAMYNRVKGRIGRHSESEREELRQDAYRAKVRALSAIGQAAILSGSDSLREELDAARRAIGDLNDAANREDLHRRDAAVRESLNRILQTARADALGS